ncbi:hypothetical protein WG907_06815 [Sphingobium sp. AN558]|uniref:hypothetical protein n=1 Tax=Sphingobium sp. AN558 TaxID=3133442 RepID=UPI0030C253B0
MTRLDNQSFETSFYGDVVFASPHEILEGPDGKIIRMLKTGHRRDEDADSLDARTIGVAADQATARSAHPRHPEMPMAWLFLEPSGQAVGRQRSLVDAGKYPFGRLPIPWSI